MAETDTADRVRGENQWVTARREAGMLECSARDGARDVAVRVEVAVRGRKWQCGHAGPNIVFFFLHGSGISASVYVTSLCIDAAP